MLAVRRFTTYRSNGGRNASAVSDTSDPSSDQFPRYRHDLQGVALAVVRHDGSGAIDNGGCGL